MQILLIFIGAAASAGGPLIYWMLPCTDLARQELGPTHLSFNVKKSLALYMCKTNQISNGEMDFSQMDDFYENSYFEKRPFDRIRNFQFLLNVY